MDFSALNDSTKSITQKIKEWIDTQDSNVDYIDIYSAYVSLKGINKVLKDLEGYKINLFIGKDKLLHSKVMRNNKAYIPFKEKNNVTKNNGRESFLSSFEDSQIYKFINDKISDGTLSINNLIHKTNNSNVKVDDVFHGKCILIKLEDGTSKLWVGSHNITLSALETEWERDSFKFNEVSTTTEDEYLSNELDKIKNKQSDFYSWTTINNIEDIMDFDEMDGLFGKLIIDSFDKKNNSQLNDFITNFDETLWKDAPFANDESLKDYQMKCVRRLHAMLLSSGGAFLNLPTGMGKTRVALALAYIWKKMRGNVLILTPNNQLPKQWLEDWKAMLTPLARKVKEDSIEYNYHYSMITEDMFSSYKMQDIGKPGSNNYRDLNAAIRDASLIIVEESHNLRNTRPTNDSRIQNLNKILLNNFNTEDGGPSILNITATPINNKISDLSNQMILFPERPIFTAQLGKNYRGVLDDSFPSTERSREIIKNMSDLIKLEEIRYIKQTRNVDVSNKKEFLGDSWKSINQEFSKDEDYKTFLDILNTIIITTDNNARIDEHFKPENFSKDNPDDNAINELIYSVKSEDIREILNLIDTSSGAEISEEKVELEDDVSYYESDDSEYDSFSEFVDKEEDIDLKETLMFGSDKSATSLTKLTLLKALESSPDAAYWIIKDFVDRWNRIKEDKTKETLRVAIKKQVDAEWRRGASEQSKETYEEKIERKVKEKWDWLIGPFSEHSKKGGPYDQLMNKFENLKVFADLEIITEDDIKKYPESKEAKLYHELKVQRSDKLSITKENKKDEESEIDVYEKTIIFCHYYRTAEYLNKLINKFDFVIEAENKVKIAQEKKSFDSKVFNMLASTTGKSEYASVKIIDKFSSFSRGFETTKKYDSLKNKDEKIKMIQDIHTSSPVFLICTDKYAEGYNMQDATKLISYDTHWNPMRILQRIGRILRVMNKELEENIYEIQETSKKIRYFWMDVNPINEVVDLPRIISFKMLAAIASNFKYPLSFDFLLEDGSERIDEIRSLVEESNKGENKFIKNIDEDNEDMFIKYFSPAELRESESFIKSELEINIPMEKNYFNNKTNVISNGVDDENATIFFVLDINGITDFAVLDKEGNDFYHSNLSSEDIKKIFKVAAFESQDKSAVNIPYYFTEYSNEIKNAVLKALDVQNKKRNDLQFVSVYIRGKND